MHSACLTGDLLGSLRCDCGEQLRTAVARIAALGGGVLLYLDQEGRGIGLPNKLRAYVLQDGGLDTVDADQHLGFLADERTYDVAAALLHELGVRRIRLLTNNPQKINSLRDHGIEVVGRMPLVTTSNTHNERYLRAKHERAGHLADLFRVILAIELLLFEFRSRSFIPLVIATTLATSVRQLLLGTGAMFNVLSMDFGIPRALPYYLVLGIVSGGIAIAFTKALYFVEDQFDRLPVPELWHPAIGGLALGIIGFFVPRVLGVGYDTLADILNNHLALKLLVLVAVCKSVALLLSLGSGTSGGLLAPMFMSSAAAGGLFAVGVNTLIPAAHLSPGACALVAMAAVFGSASRATFAFIVFAFEIVHDFNAVLPLMLVSVIASAIAMRYLPNSIMTEKLARRGLDIHQDYEANALKQLKVAEVMARDVATIMPEETVRAAADRFTSGDLKTSRHHALPIVDAAGRLQGLVTQGDLLRALQADPAGEMTVIDAGTRSLTVAYPEERVFDAVTKMLENNVGRLPVVDRTDPHKLVGHINRANVMGSWRGHLHEEFVREHGWFRNLRAGGDEDGGGVATGRVAAINQDEIRILLNGNGDGSVEEFALHAPARGVSKGDEVRVNYRNDEGKKIAFRIEELSSRQ